MLSALALLPTLFTVISAQSILFPNPDPNSHNFVVAVSHFPLTDSSRKDVYEPTEDRSIMVSLFMPVATGSCTSECQNAYMLDQTAGLADQQFLQDPQGGVFGKLGYTSCCETGTEIDASKVPVVVLEPQTDTSRLLYVNMARYISANGVAVLLLDHPREASIVEFVPPVGDKTAVYNRGTVPLSEFADLTEYNASITTAIDTRVDDIKFALAQISSQQLLQTQFPNLHFSSALNTDSYAVIGHGLGGTVATSLSFSVPSLRFSINLSGSSPILQETSAAPIYFFGRANFRRENDINWPNTWPKLTGPATEFDLADSEIFDYSDLPVVVELGQNEGGMKDLKGRGLGSQGARGNHAQVCFVEAIVRKELLGDDTALTNCVNLFDNMVPHQNGTTKMRRDMLRSFRRPQN